MISNSKEAILKRRIAALAIVLLILTLGSVVPFTKYATGPCRIVSSAIWSLKHPGAGEIIAEWEQNYLNVGSGRILMNFDRPDLVEIHLNENLVNGGMVKAGDTLATIVSREVSGRLRVIEAEVEYARAEREVLRAGERGEDIEVARRRSQRALARLDAFQSEYDRVKTLYEDGIATLSLWQQTEGKLLVLQTELELAEARVDASKAGAKTQEVRVAEAEILRLERELERVSRTLGFSEVVVSPINGKIYLGGAPGTVLTVERMDTLTVIAAFQEEVIQDIEPGQSMLIRLTGRRELLLDIPLKSTGFFSGDTSGAFATAMIDNSEGFLQPGMMGKVKVSRGRHTLLEGFGSFFKGSTGL